MAGIVLATVLTMWLKPISTMLVLQHRQAQPVLQLLPQALVLRQLLQPQQQQVQTTTLDALYIPSTSTCSSTLVTPCTTTTTLIANCQSYEVQWNNHCYYLDGTNGTCTTGYTLGTNAILNCIATQFAGKTYRNDISNNCCVWSADTYQCYGFAVGCNSPGPFTVGPTVSGAGCTNLQLRNSLQLSFCGSI
ncbi:hypothetical protein I4U23_016846 [Adineta vaga]|nr:hypothetical protein I4U23_016846 [Adineta vaga]